MRNARARVVGSMGVGLLVAAAAVAACGASEPTSAEAAAAETADTVCSLLRDWNNDLTGVFNSTSDAITDADDPDTSVDELVAGFDEMVVLAADHRAELDDLDLPAVAERDELIAELTVGADESIEVLEDERAETVDLAPIEVDDQAGALGGASVGLERATSVLEPSIGTYQDEALREAFAADEDCEHVIQPF